MSIRIKIREWRYKLYLYNLLKSGLNNDFPSMIAIQTINRCNSNCVMCPYSAITAKKKLNLMTFDLFDKILSELKYQKGFKRLVFCLESEPLMDARLVKFAKKFKEVLPDKELEIVTNGILLNPKTIKEVYNYFDLVSISVNAFKKETYNKVMNGLDFDVLTNNLDLISKNPFYLKKTILRFINTKDNQYEKKIFKKYFNRKGFMVFGFDINKRLGSVDDFENIKPASNFIKKIKFSVYKIFGKFLFPTCPIPFFGMYVKANGDCIQCFNDWKNNVIDNISKKSIKQVFNSKKYKKIRLLMKKNSLTKNLICKDCDLYKEGLWLTA